MAFSHSLTWSRLSLIGLLTFTAASGCAAPTDEQDEEAVTAEAAASEATYPVELKPLLGEWKLAVAETRLADRTDRIRVVVKRANRSESDGLELSILAPDGLGFRDRAPFVGIGERRDCTKVSQGGAKSLGICHETRILGTADIEHTVKITAYDLYLVPRGSETATQRLKIDEQNRLHYEYAIDGDVMESVFFDRAR